MYMNYGTWHVGCLLFRRMLVVFTLKDDDRIPGLESNKVIWVIRYKNNSFDTTTAYLTVHHNIDRYLRKMAKPQLARRKLCGKLKVRERRTLWITRGCLLLYQRSSYHWTEECLYENSSILIISSLGRFIISVVPKTLMKKEMKLSFSSLRREYADPTKLETK
jgi:hypothetical protein